MTGRHVVRDGGVLAVAARSQVRGDPLAAGEDLDGAGGETDLHLGAREAVGDAVEVIVDVDVVVDANAAHAPFGKNVWLDRQ